MEDGKNIYHKNSITIGAKIRHYSTVIKLEALYAAECSDSLMEREVEEKDKKKKNHCKIMRLKIDEHINYSLKSNK